MVDMGGLASQYNACCCGCGCMQAQQLRALRGTPLEALPDAKALHKLARSGEDAHVLRQAGNAPIQSSSADILKAALVQLHSTLTLPPYNCRLLLTVCSCILAV